MDREDLVQRLDDIFIEFSEALIYDEQDASFLELIHQLAVPLGYHRVGRLALEAIIYSESRVAPLEELLETNSFVAPQEIRSLLSLRKLLHQLHDTISLDNSRVLHAIEDLELAPLLKRSAPDYSWLVQKHDIGDSTKKLYQKYTNKEQDVVVSTKDWTAIAVGLQDVFSLVLKSKKRVYYDDPYSYTMTPINVTKLVMPHGEAVTMQSLSDKNSSEERIDSEDVIMTEEPASESGTPQVQVQSEEHKDKVIPDNAQNSEQEQTTEKSLEQPSELTTDKSSEQPSELNTDKPSEQAIEQSTQQNSDGPNVESHEPLEQTPDVEPGLNADIHTPTEDKKKRKFDNIEDSARSRSSKRVRAKAGEQSLDNIDVSGDEDFFEQLNSFLALSNCHFDSVLGIFLENTFERKDQYISDFKYLLQTWDDDQADVFLKTDSTPSTDKSQPIMQLLDSAASGHSEILKPPFVSPLKDVERFIQTINSGDFHLQEVRQLLLETLLTSRSVESEQASIIADYWPNQLMDAVRKSAEAVEPHVYEAAKSTFSLGDDDQTLRYIEVAQGLFEMFTDHYLGLEKQLRNNAEFMTKLARKDSEIAKEASHVRLLRWKGMVQDLVGLYRGSVDKLGNLLLRHEWVRTTSGTIYGDNPGDSLKLFEEFRRRFQDQDQNLELEFANFPSIPKLSLEGISTQISKFRAASIFARLFGLTKNNKHDDENVDDHDDDLDDDQFNPIEVLEAILMPDDGGAQVPEHEAIFQFLSTASLEFKLQLWSLLLDSYNDNGQSQKAFDGYMRILISSIQEVSSETYADQSDHKRSAVLLRSLNVCSDICKSLMDLAMADASVVESLPKERLRNALEALIKLLRVLHIYILFDDVIINNIIQAPSHASWEKTTRQLKDLIVFAWGLFYLFFRHLLPEQHQTPEVINDTLSIIHEQIGTRGYCGLAGGSFLELSLRELVKLDWPESEADMLQCLHCRYDLGLGNDYYAPYDHHTTPKDLDRPAALALSKFIMNLIMRKKNLSQSILRVDIKSVLDQFYEAIGNPDPEKVAAISQNKNVLDTALSQPYISMGYLQSAMKGTLQLSFVPGHDEIMKVGQQGFYYVLGLAQLTSIRSRKRLVPGRVEEAEEAIKYFHFDLMCNTSRFESWLGLAQAYDVLAEDDLTWTAEKLNTKELRVGPASHQRKSIICCCQAVSLYLQRKTAESNSTLPSAFSAHIQQLESNLWPFFARALYNACRSPMKMDAFLSGEERIYCGPDGLYKKKPNTNIRADQILRLVYTCEKIAISANPTDWYNYYLRAKVLHNLGIKPHAVLKSLTSAVKNCPERTGGHGENVFEPHYKLIAMAYKYVRQKTVSPEFALDLIRETPYCTDSFTPEFDIEGALVQRNLPESEVQFYKLCIIGLQKLKATDKKRWHHRPQFRLAKIYDQILMDKQRAKDEMTPFFQKGTSKAPLHIWKPDIERPGQHFEFVYEYVIYYVTLLQQTKDAVAIANIARKLRKFGQGMTKHQAAWEYTCSSAAATAKEILRIPHKYTDTVIHALQFEQFDKESGQMVEYYSKSDVGAPVLALALNYSVEMRRLNSGFGSTAALDDLLVAIYFKIYREYVLSVKNEDSAAVPGAVQGSQAPPQTAQTAQTSQIAQLSQAATPGWPKEPASPLPSSPSTPKEPSTPGRINIFDLISPEPAPSPSGVAIAPAPPAGDSQPQSQSQTPQVPGSGTKSATVSKVRVARRDVITRAIALAKVLSPKLDSSETSKFMLISKKHEFLFQESEESVGNGNGNGNGHGPQVQAPVQQAQQTQQTQQTLQVPQVQQLQQLQQSPQAPQALPSLTQTRLPFEVQARSQATVNTSQGPAPLPSNANGAGLLPSFGAVQDHSDSNPSPQVPMDQTVASGINPTGFSPGQATPTSAYHSAQASPSPNASTTDKGDTQYPSINH